MSYLEDEWRWTEIESSLGALAASEHDWDEDAAAWARAQRRGKERRSG